MTYNNLILFLFCHNLTRNKRSSGAMDNASAYGAEDCRFDPGNGQNYENQNVENQKELRKPCKPSQRRKDLLKRSERRKANYHNVEKS